MEPSLRRRQGVPPGPPPAAVHVPESDAKRAVPSAARARSWLVPLVLFVLALAVRVYQLASPAEVVFDEVHFGKFAAFYVTGRVRGHAHTVLL